MFHVKQILLFIFFILIFQFCNAQGSITLTDKAINYQLPQDITLQKVLSGNKDFIKLSKEEQELVYYLNYVRKKPSIFLDKVVNLFLSYHPELVSSYSKSLQSTLANQVPLNVIMPDSALSIVSRNHANDLRIHNVISHQSSNGKSFQERTAPFIKVCGSECIHAAQSYNSLEAIMFLLFDFNVSNLGHRKTILDPRFTRGGFGVSLASQGTSMAVMDFSCQ